MKHRLAHRERKSPIVIYQLNGKQQKRSPNATFSNNISSNQAPSENPFCQQTLLLHEAFTAMSSHQVKPTQWHLL
jgi:hypothetical protein